MPHPEAFELLRLVGLRTDCLVLYQGLCITERETGLPRGAVRKLLYRVLFAAATLGAAPARM